MTPGVLLLACGNPARGDDGLGPELARQVNALGLPGLRVDSDYQLTVEDSAAVADADVVIFADADMTGPEPFSLRRLTAPNAGPGFSSHGVTAGEVLALARDLFGAEPEAWILGIRGHAFEPFDEELTARARANLATARAHLVGALTGAGLKEERP